MARVKKPAAPASPEAKPKRKKSAKTAVKRTPRTKQAIEKIAQEAKETGLKTRYGRPSIYPRDEFELQALADRIYALAEEGKSFATMSVEIDIPRKTLTRWAEEHEAFSAVLARAKDLEQRWWEERARTGINDKGFNAHVWSKSVSARFRADYSERAAVELTGKDGKDLIPEGSMDKMELARWVGFVMVSGRDEAKKLAEPEGSAE